MLDGLLSIVNGPYLVYMILGVFVGIVVGALPGFTATMGVALLLPFTFSMDPGPALAMLAALYISANFADAVPACLVNTPGTPAAVATSVDGFQMTRQGRAQEALIGASLSALVGTLVGGTIFLLLAPPLASVALRFGPAEYFWLTMFALTIVGSVAGDSLLKGIGGGLIGILVSCVGLSPTGEVTRYAFGFSSLIGGIALTPALVGIFAIPQLLNMVGSRRTELVIAKFLRRRGVAIKTILYLVSHPVNLVRSSLIGTAIGIMPGAGGPVASLVSYNEAVRWDRRNRGQYGKGAIDGVVASETAGNGAACGSLVPMVALGIPGSGPSAVILGALLLQGLRPGPSLFVQQPDLVYGWGWSVLLAGVVTFAVAGSMAGTLARLVQIPVRFLAPLVLFLSIIGAYAVRNNIIDVFAMFFLGLMAFLLSKVGVHPAPIGLGIILGPILEPALIRGISLSNTSSVFEVFFSRPESWVIIGITILSLVWIVWSRRGAEDPVNV